MIACHSLISRVEPLPDGGVVEIIGSIAADERLAIDVTNPKADGARSSRAGHGMALDNIRERLALAYPGQSWSRRTPRGTA